MTFQNINLFLSFPYQESCWQQDIETSYSENMVYDREILIRNSKCYSKLAAIEIHLNINIYCFIRFQYYPL
jgi:hypothetical protein